MTNRPLEPKELGADIAPLAQALFNAANAEKRRLGKDIFTPPRPWKDQPSETKSVWFAVALRARR